MSRYIPRKHDYDVEAHNVSNGERLIICVNADSEDEAFAFAMRRKDFIRDIHKGYLWTFRVEYRI